MGEKGERKRNEAGWWWHSASFFFFFYFLKTKFHHVAHALRSPDVMLLSAGIMGVRHLALHTDHPAMLTFLSWCLPQQLWAPVSLWAISGEIYVRLRQGLCLIGNPQRPSLWWILLCFLFNLGCCPSYWLTIGVRSQDTGVDQGWSLRANMFILVTAQVVGRAA